MKLLAKGEKAKSFGATQLNARSSRAHTVITFHIERRVSAAAPVTVSKIHLVRRLFLMFFFSFMLNCVQGEFRIAAHITLCLIHVIQIDLAGSERLSDSKSEGDRMVEAQHINSSLTALGISVTFLCPPPFFSFLSYRCHFTASHSLRMCVSLVLLRLLGLC